MWNSAVILVMLVVILGVGLNLRSLIRKYRHAGGAKSSLIWGIVFSVLVIGITIFYAIRTYLNQPY